MGEKIRKEVISLPVLIDAETNQPKTDETRQYHKDGYIPDWEYMQERIKELEQERIKELEQYLIVTGLNDYELSEEDKEVLATKLFDGGQSGSLISGDGYWKEAREFQLIELFTISTTKGIDKNKINFEIDAPYDFVGRTSVNWGTQGTSQKLEYQANPKDSFSLVQVGESVALWREKEWYASQNLFLLNPKLPEIKDIFLYLQTAINKEMSRYGKAYNSYPTLKSLNKTNILLPIQTTSEKEPVIDEEKRYHPEGYVPDWEYMEKYIRALEKVVVKDVVEWKNEMIEKTKMVVEE